MEIALLEDNPSDVKLIQEFLESSGHECTVYNNGQALIDNIQDKNLAILIIDWELPDISGDKILQWVRNTIGTQLPVIFVSGRDTTEDIVSMLDAGADDYLTKPVILQELLARITALVRRSQIYVEQRDIIEITPFTLDFNRHCITKFGVEILLTPKEFELAGYLLRNIGNLVPRNILLQEIWGYGPEIHTRTIDIHISRLRKKLGFIEENGWCLTSIYHKGYRLERLEPAQ